MKYISILFLILISVQSAFPEICIDSAEKAVLTGLEHSTERKLELLYTMEKLKGTRIAIQPFLPALTFSWNEDDRIIPGNPDSRMKQLNMGISHKIFDGGKSRLNYEMNLSESYLEYYSHLKSLKNFECSITESYFSCMNQMEKCQIAGQLLENMKALEPVFNKQLENGFILQSEYLEYVIAVKKADIQLQEEKETERRNIEDFKELLGLKDEQVEIITVPLCNEITESMLLKPHESMLSASAKSKSIELRKLKQELEYEKKLNAFQKRIFIPSVSIASGISFSGKNYPLTEPQYTLSVGISFENNPYMQAAYENKTGFRKNRLNEYGNSFSSQIHPDLSHGNRMNMADIKVNMDILGIRKMEKNISDSIARIIEKHDEEIMKHQVENEVLSLMHEKNEISRIQVVSGMMKKSDFLNELVEISKQEMNISEQKMRILLYEKQLSIETGIPIGLQFDFGGKS